MTSMNLLIGLVAIALVLAIVWDAFETILVPRRIGRRVRFTRYFYILSWRLWRTIALRVNPAPRREAVLGFFGPISLILLLLCWASGLILAFALLSLASGGQATSGHLSFPMLVYMSGETFFTLGFGDVTPATSVGRFFSVLEAGLGFGFLGTVVGYLPTMYAAFSQREVEISLMDARAGSPPSAAEFLRRTSAHGDRELCDDLLATWERWAAQLLESHISYPQLAYYRSQHSNQSWLASLTTMLDATSLLLARPGSTATSQAHLTHAMARHALVDITQIFVRRYPGIAAERLGPQELARVRARLADTVMAMPDDASFQDRLTELRLGYEPYAQALAAYLLLELPHWAHAQPRRDNWQGGPWDKLLHAQHGPHRAEEHF